MHSFVPSGPKYARQDFASPRNEVAGLLSKFLLLRALDKGIRVVFMTSNEEITLS